MFNNIGDDRTPQVSQVGWEYKGGMEGDAQIAEAMGWPAGIFGGQLLRQADDDEWRQAPRYSQNVDASLEILEEMEVCIFIKETIVAKPRGKMATPEYVALFELDDRLYITNPRESDGEAAACALWFVLKHKSALT